MGERALLCWIVKNRTEERELQCGYPHITPRGGEGLAGEPNRGVYSAP